MNIYVSFDLGYYASKELIYMFNRYVEDKFNKLIENKKIINNGAIIWYLTNQNRLPTDMSQSVISMGISITDISIIKNDIFLSLSLSNLKINWESFLKFNWNLNNSTHRYLYNLEMDYIPQKLSDYDLDKIIDRLWSRVIENRDDHRLIKNIHDQIDYQWSGRNKKTIAIKLLLDFLENLEEYLINVRQSLSNLSNYIHFNHNLNETGVIHCLKQIPIQYQNHIPKQYLLK